MVNTLRRFSKPIMLVVTVLVVVSFMVWSPNMSHSTGATVVENIYGKPVTLEQYQRQERKMRIFARLGAQYAQLLDPQSMNRGTTPMGVLRSMVFEHEADNLGITVTEKDKEDVFFSLPAFHDQTGHVDPKAFDLFVENVMNPAGFSKDQINDFLISEARIRRVRELIGTSVAATPEQIKEQLKLYQMRVEASYVELKQSDYTKDVTVSDEELKKEYDENKDSLKTEEQRTVRYAAFLLPPPPDAKPYPQGVQAELQQQMAEKAYALREALEKKDSNFEELAKQMGAKVGVTDFFEQENPPADLESSPAAGEAAFALKKEAPYSTHLTAERGMARGAYVLAYGETKAPETRPFESVKETLTTKIKARKAAVILNEKAKEVRTKIDEALKAGKAFHEAVEALKLKPVQYPLYGGDVMPPRGTPHMIKVREVAQKLGPGQLSELTNDKDDVLIIYLYQRTESPITPKEEEMGKRALTMLNGRLDNLAFAEWLSERARSAGLVPRPQLSME